MPVPPAGVPSGHVMISTAVLLTCTHYLTKSRAKQPMTSSGAMKDSVASIVTFIRMCVLVFGVVIGLTRVLISSHFIHQVILGLAVGYIIDTVSSHSTIFLSKLQWTLPNNNINFFISAAALFFSGVAIYYCLQLVGLDPEFSVPLAMEYCRERSWVHPDTTPFYSLMRSTGALLGMEVITMLAGEKVTKAERNWSRERISMNLKVIGLAFSLVVVALLHSKYIPSFVDSSGIVFYSVAMFKAALIPCVTFLVCIFCNKYNAM